MQGISEAHDALLKRKAKALTAAAFRNSEFAAAMRFAIQEAKRMERHLQKPPAQK